MNGDVIPLAATGRNTEFEEVFTALSALLNGGGVSQIQTISVELSNALSGRETQVKDVLNQLTTLVSTLDANKQNIVRALNSIDALARKLAQQKGTLAKALDNIPSALKVLADQRQDLTRVLTSLSKLGGIGTTVIRATHDNTVASLRSLQPVLDSLVASKANIVNSLELLLNFPFPASSVNGVHGDYAGLYASVDLNITDLIAGLTGPSSPTTTCPAGTVQSPARRLPSARRRHDSEAADPSDHSAAQAAFDERRHQPAGAREDPVAACSAACSVPAPATRTPMTTRV